MNGNEEAVVRGPVLRTAGLRTRGKERRLGGRRCSPFWTIGREIPRRTSLILGVISLVAPLLVWMVLRAANVTNAIFLPSPLDVVRAGWDLVASGELAADTGASVQRIAIGFALSLLVSVPLGLAMGTFKGINAPASPSSHSSATCRPPASSHCWSSGWASAKSQNSS